MTCKLYSRAYLHNLVAKGLPFAAHLVSYHNIAYTQSLTKRIREAIQEQRFPDFVHTFVRCHYPKVTHIDVTSALWNSLWSALAFVKEQHCIVAQHDLARQDHLLPHVL